MNTMQNPLTRNRYSYVTNNPLNYTDPTGHSLWSRFKSGVKSVARKVVNTVKTVARTVVNTVKRVASWVVNAVTHPKQTINSVQQTVQRTYKRAVSAGSSFVQSVSNGYQSVQRTYTSFKSYVAERTSEIKTTVIRELCNFPDRVLTLWENKGPSMLRVISSKYDHLDKSDTEKIKGVADLFNFVWSKTAGKWVINKVTNNNKLEEDLFGIVSGPVSNYLAFQYNKEKDYYYTNDGKTIQKLSGFMNVFDDVGGFLGMDLDTEIVSCKYNGINYRLQFWKGTYGYGNAYGGEIGMYSNTDGNGWYASVDGDQEIRTSQKIISKNSGQVLLENDVASYTEDGTHFWNLAIRTDSGYKKRRSSTRKHSVYTR